MRVQQYGREVRRYGKCWAREHGQWYRRMPEVVAVDWLAFLDVQRTLQVTHRSKPTHEAKTTTAEMPTARLGGGVPAADAAPGALDSGKREPPLAGRELAEGREPDLHRLRTGEQRGAEQLGIGADQAQRQGRDGAGGHDALHGEPRGSAGGAADTAERERGARRWPALEPGSGPVGKGEICPRDSPKRARRRMRLASLWRDPAVAETVSGPPCSSFREGSVGYPEPIREPTESTLGSGSGRQRGISSCEKSKPRRGWIARSRLSRQRASKRSGRSTHRRIRDRIEEYSQSNVTCRQFDCSVRV